MKKTLTTLFTLIALTMCTPKVFAQCACPTPQPCCPTATAPCPCQEATPCSPCAQPCCPTTQCPCDCSKAETWFCPQCVEAYFCRLGLTECQKCAARQAVEQFKCCVQCLPTCCASRCQCREYRKALRDLDCKIKNIITDCQKKEYKCVRSEVKSQVKCCHRCLIGPKFCRKCSCQSPSACPCNSPCQPSCPSQPACPCPTCQ